MRKIIGHLAGNDKGIAFCRKVDPVLNAELQQLTKDKADEKDAANKRKSDAAAAAVSRSTTVLTLPKSSTSAMSSAPFSVILSYLYAGATAPASSLGTCAVPVPT